MNSGAVYHTTRVVTVTDRNLQSVTLNGEPVTLVDGKLTLAGNTNATYTVKATDKAGNVTEYTVTMQTITGLTDPIKNITDGNVTGNDKQGIEQVIAAVDAELGNTDLTGDERQELVNAKEEAKKLLAKIDEVAGKKDDLTDQVTGWDKDAVTSDDKQDIQDLIDKLDELLGGDNLTEGEKEELGQTKEKAEDLIDRIDEVANEKDNLTDQVTDWDKDAVTSDDKQDIQDLIDKLDELLDGNNLTEDEKEELGQTKKEAAELIGRIEEAEESAGTENIDRTNDITADTVTTGDKADLEAAKDDLENALAGYGNNLTDDEKQEIQDSIDRIEKALKVISRVETVKDLIGNLPEVLTEDNADTVREALRAYNALTAYEQSLLGANLKAKLMSAKWAVEGAGEPADTPKNDTPTTDKPADEGGDIGAEENTKTGVTSALPAALAVAVAVSAATLWLTGKRRKA